MNTISGGTLIRQKAKVEVVFEMETPVVLCNPREDDEGNMYVCSQGGEILQYVDDGQYTTYLAIGGIPNCIAFNTTNGQTDLYITDISHYLIYERKFPNEMSVLTKSYEGEPLKGPTSIIFNKKENYLIFSDSGCFGTTSLNKPKGSIFHWDLNTSIMKPLMLNCLAYPNDIVYDESIDTLYATETFNNRVLKLTQNPSGVFHCSVFHTFNGGIGPSSLALDELGNLYVSKFEFQDANGTIDGSIVVLNREGMLIRELVIPNRSEINGMFIQKNKKEANDLYFTERNFSGVLRIKLSQLNAEMDKMHDLNMY